jgi:hypothetical protein
LPLHAARTIAAKNGHASWRRRLPAGFDERDLLDEVPL